MMRFAFALLFISTLAHADTLPYEVAFNEHGYAYTQTATMVGGDSAVVWFITPGEGRFVIQVGNASDSAAIQHRVVLTDGTATNTLATQQGIYPSFYVTLGQNLSSWTGYIMYIYNEDAAGTPSCAPGATCNLTVLIQEAVQTPKRAMLN